MIIDKVVELLKNGKVGAIFQGAAESGSRALGNRSIIADPRLENGKDIVNTVKNREWYRPFAASILKEEAREWFGMGGLEESPWMLFAIPVLESKKGEIPAVIHVDGTCRVQTVTRQQNEHFYELIKAFHKSTGVPLLLNTSLNLGGEPLVHTKQEAIDLLHRSPLDFLYLPDTKELLEE